MSIFLNAKNNVLSGFAVGVVALPTVIGLGIFVYSALGADFAVQGAAIGMLSAAVMCILIAIFGQIPAQITAPSSTASFVLAGIAAELVQISSSFEGFVREPAYLAGWLSMVVLCAGVFQLLFSYLRIGQAIKYVPYPVVAGFLNGIGVLFVVYQWKMLLGLDTSSTYSVDEVLENMSGWSVVIGVITVLALFSAKEWKKRYPTMPPAPVVGIFLGTGLYYYLSYFGYRLGPVLGSLSISMDTIFATPKFLSSISFTDFSLMFAFIIKSGFTLAVVMSLSTLLTVLLVEVYSEAREDANVALKAHGFAHLFSSMFGGLAGTPSLTLINLQMGGSSKLSAITCGGFLLACLLLLQDVVAGIPYVVVAGVLVYFGLNIIDLSGIKLLWRSIHNHEKLHIILVDQLLAVSVTVSTVVFGLTTAVAIGTAAAIFLYFIKSGKKAIKKYYSAGNFHSKVRRTSKQREILAQHGTQIMVYELQGSIFFGAADELIDKIEMELDEITYLILDFKYAYSADITGIKAIQKLNNSLCKKSKFLLISSLEYKGPIFETMHNLGIIEQIGEKNFFFTTDTALDWAETQLLHGMSASEQEIPWQENRIFMNFTKAELEHLGKYLQKECYQTKQIIYSKGDPHEKIYFLTKGKIQIRRVPTKQLSIHRLMSVVPGNTFAAVGFINQEYHSNYAKAQQDSEVYTFSREKLKIIEQEYPLLMIKLLKGIAFDLSTELENAREDVFVYESD